MTGLSFSLKITQERLDATSTPLHVLQELGGRETAEMVRRYAHLTVEHLAPFADRLSGLRVVDGNVGHVFTTVPK